MATSSSSVSALSSKLASTVKAANSAIATASAQGKDTSAAQNAVNKSSSMLAQTKAQGGSSYKGSSYEKAYNATPVITPQNVAPVDQVKLPTAPVVNPGDIASQMNAALAPTLSGTQTTYNATTGMYEPVPPAADTGYKSNLDQYLKNLTAPVSTADIYAKEYKDAQIKQKQEAVNQYTGQLNAITAKAQADQLKLEGQGRGITDTIIGGQQAQINREAAIAALPVQAQLAAAQGNLQMAQEHVDKMFQIKSQDALAQYQFKSKIADTLFQFANEEQTRALNAKKEADARAYDEKKTNLSLANDWAKTAIEYGQSSLAGQIMRLDTSSPTYTQDLAKLQGQVRKPVAPVVASKRDTQFNPNGDLIDMQTGEVITKGTNNAGTITGKPQTEGQAKVNAYADRMAAANRLVSNIGDQFANPLAFGGILPNFMKSSDRQVFEQAQSDFITAVLRQESGAVISDSEFARDQAKYFPQRGDGADVLLNKAELRNTAINSYYKEANVPRPVVAGDIIVDNGIKYVVQEDGQTIVPLNQNKPQSVYSQSTSPTM